MSEVIRTKQHGCFRATADPWGVAYDPCPDPLAERDGRPSFEYTAPKITSDQWRAIVSLFDYLARPDNPTTRGTSEVQVVLARPVDGSADRFRVFVPRQTVDRTEVDAEMDLLLELETGEPFDGIPEGWADAGTVHSHNYMGAFWSGTDNADQIKRWGLHLVVGDLNKHEYEIKARVTRPNQVVDLPWQTVVDACAIPVANHFAPAVLSVISLKSPTVTFGPSRYCAETKCYKDHLKDSLYCEEHQVKTKPTSVFYCRHSTCINEIDGAGAYCVFHKEEREELVEGLKAQDEDECIAEIRRVIDSHERAFGPPSDAFWAALRKEVEDGVA